MTAQTLAWRRKEETKNARISLEAVQKMEEILRNSQPPELFSRLERFTILEPERYPSRKCGKERPGQEMIAVQKKRISKRLER